VFIKITRDEVGGRVGINRGRKAPYFTRHFDGFPARGRKAPYFTRHFDGFPALIPWFSTGSMVSLIPSFITYQFEQDGNDRYMMIRVDKTLISRITQN
jgi:hypothetical protein